MECVPPRCLEHYVVHVLRNDPAFVPQLDLVMEQEGELIGHVMYMHAAITADDSREIPIMTFGPISIRPDLQRQGLGKYLLDYSMEKAKELGAGVLCIEGNLDFYGQSGFVLAGTRGIRYHGEPEQELVPYFLLKELRPGFLDGVTGVYHTPQGYYVDEAAAEVFDQAFRLRKIETARTAVLTPGQNKRVPERPWIHPLQTSRPSWPKSKDRVR